MPKQEKLAIYLKNNLNYSCVIINGGAIIDFWGKKIKRAPLWIRNFKIEWIYRLILEPKRLGHRYIIGNFVFMKRFKFRLKPMQN